MYILHGLKRKTKNDELKKSFMIYTFFVYLRIVCNKICDRQRLQPASMTLRGLFRVFQSPSHHSSLKKQHNVQHDFLTTFHAILQQTIQNKIIVKSLKKTTATLLSCLPSTACLICLSNHCLLSTNETSNPSAVFSPLFLRNGTTTFFPCGVSM